MPYICSCKVNSRLSALTLQFPIFSRSWWLLTKANPSFPTFCWLSVSSPVCTHPCDSSFKNKYTVSVPVAAPTLSPACSFTPDCHLGYTVQQLLLSLLALSRHVKCVYVRSSMQQHSLFKNSCSNFLVKFSPEAHPRRQLPRYPLYAHAWE